MDETLTPLQRFFLAFVAFFYVLTSRRFAEEVKLACDRQRTALPPAAPTYARPPVAAAPVATPPPTPIPAPPTPAAAVAPAEALPTSPTPAAAPAAIPALTQAPAPPPTATAAPVSTPAPVEPAPSPHAEALHVLSLLQRDARLLDFVSESLEGFSDSAIGAAARTVHAGCRKVFESYLDLEPVYPEPEGADVTVAPGFDPTAVRLTGNVVGAPPFKGSLRHHGWRATRASFPPLPPSQDPRILAPAEVEL
ncbi:MAG: hypothetical protein A2V77_23570 [Anaeromyxobacter sp. RBG_16_69_14]|nr:MAG: hypothetical protein A2V77_23570 [Anaeromyxobacter sp. RBG_16_69_14]